MQSSGAEDRAYPGVTAEAGEQTPLFVVMPSAQSTKDPSLTNLQGFGTLGEQLVGKADDDERSSTNLQIHKPLPKDYGRSGPFYLCRSFLCSLPGKICSAVLIMVIIGLFFFGMQSAKKTTANFGFRNPLSTISPVNDLNVPLIGRPPTTDPPKLIIRKNSTHALPTNIWYLNLMLAGTGQPSSAQNVFTLPYLVDVAGIIPGLHISPQQVGGTMKVVNLIDNPVQGVVLGVAEDATANQWSGSLSKKYTLPADLSSPLAVTLDWDVFPMSSTIVRGMPYGTMHYQKGEYTSNGTVLLPTFAAQVPLRSSILVDGSGNVTCGSTSPTHFKVQKDIQMTFAKSDFTWILFFSEPVWLQCISNEKFGKAETLIQVRSPSNMLADDLTIRLALVSSCTTGTNPIFCKGPVNEAAIDSMTATLRKHADVYPGPKANFAYEVDNDKNAAMVTFDWDPRSLFDKTSVHASELAKELITFAMPHHMDSFGTTPADYAHCTRTFLGEACLVSGSVWKLPHELPPVSFWASTPPSPEYLPQVADALRGDMNFTLPSYYLEGGGDTYFSGKMLAKLARILLIGQQLFDVCAKPTPAYSAACKQAILPSQEDMNSGIARLRSAVEIWFNGTAMTPFVYDANWGGYISCGCFFDQKTQGCSNRYPNCPSVSNPGLNFGNGFYNDHHFHYGYFIYSSAAVAYFDPAWGRKNFDKINLWVRDIANPSTEDTYFAVTRNKDWYRGHSWAGGITPPVFVAGRNQESTSEAINAYEGVSLYGEVMTNAWKQVNDHQKLAKAEEIRDVGKILLATELQSVDEYWHVRDNSTIYESFYGQNVVGILWSVMAEFQTWFGGAPYLPYGIQLLPITAVSQQRDTPDWARQMYSPFANACNADPNCEAQGWSILELCILSEVGHTQDAFSKALKLPSAVFLSAGGNGQSLTNTLWYISTRPQVKPLDILPPPPPVNPAAGGPPGSAGGAGGPPGAVAQKHVTNCGLPHNCTAAVLDTMAAGFTCRARMDWLMNYKSDSEKQACAVVGGLEFPKECGACATSYAKATPTPSFNCGLPGKCTPKVLSTDASGYTCMSRIKWLIDSQGITEQQACYSVGAFEFPSECGACSPKKPPVIKQQKPKTNLPGVISCGHPATCTGKALNQLAAGYTCLARMTWLMTVRKFNELDACALVSAVEYPQECGACNPAA